MKREYSLGHRIYAFLLVYLMLLGPATIPAQDEKSSNEYPPETRNSKQTILPNDDGTVDLSRNVVALGMPDFNNDGYADAAIGVPGENVFQGQTGNPGAGAVNVIYGGPDGFDTGCCAGRPSPQIWTQDSVNVPGAAEAADHFGTSLASADFNGDGFSDLAIGVPDERVNSETDAGAVNIIYGSFAGLTTTAGSNIPAPQIWTQDSAGIPSSAEFQDRFGESLAWGDFDNDGIADLAIGVPMEDAGNVQSAGAVNILFGTPSGLSAAGSQIWTQDTIGIPEQAESSDFFGKTLAAGDFDGNGCDDLVIGTPSEDITLSDGTTVSAAGALTVIYGNTGEGLTSTNGSVPATQFWTQNSSFVPDTAEAADQFGLSLAAADFNGGNADIAIGSAEGVFVLYGRNGGLSATSGVVIGGQQDVTAQLWTTSDIGFPEYDQPNSHLGSALAAGDFDGDGKKDLAVGAPDLNLSSQLTDAGAVFVIFGSSFGLSTSFKPAQMWTEDSPGISGVAESFNRFGKSLSAADFGHSIASDLVVGVPFQTVSSESAAGAVNAIFGSPSGLSSTSNKVYHQNSSNVPGVSEAEDNFGFSFN